jgi:hypothetical protein
LQSTLRREGAAGGRGLGRGGQQGIEGGKRVRELDYCSALFNTACSLTIFSMLSRP